MDENNIPQLELEPHLEIYQNLQTMIISSDMEQIIPKALELDDKLVQQLIRDEYRRKEMSDLKISCYLHVHRIKSVDKGQVSLPQLPITPLLEQVESFVRENFILVQDEKIRTLVKDAWYSYRDWCKKCKGKTIETESMFCHLIQLRGFTICTEGYPSRVKKLSSVKLKKNIF